MRYVILLILFLWPRYIFAQEMFSPSYTLELEQIESSPEAEIESLNPLEKKEFSENGFIIYPPDNEIFQFSISDTRISLDNLSNNATQVHSILSTVDSTDVYGYQLLAIPMQGLETPNGDQIAPTTCDISKGTCTITRASEWKSTQTYGWGYSISGPDAPADFIDEYAYRPFKTGVSGVAAKNQLVTSQRATKITIKTVTSPETAEGNYGSVIKLLALPSL